ncbi:hypothetical protein HZS_1861 [Henneguya salminicola]|nr:hypothetical protein HZS_1861 [Henneguya salminicola]
MNNGRCIGTASNYYCNCSENYYGKKCEYYKDFNKNMRLECSMPNNCKVACIEGWSGKYCDNFSCNNYKKCKNNSCIFILKI